MLNEHYDAWLRTPEQFTNIHLIFNEKWFVFGAL